MDIHNIARIHWACRRGMRELDVLIMPFFDNEYSALSDQAKRDFIELLSYQDPQLFSWLMNQTVPENEHLARMVKRIQIRNQQYGFAAL